MKGRKKTPTKLALLRGNPGKRALNKHEPQPPKEEAVPPPPAYLEPIAKAEWKRFAPVLFNLGLLTVADDTAFAGYCQQYALWISIQRQLQKQAKDIKAVRVELSKMARDGDEKAQHRLNVLPESHLLVQDYKVDPTGLEHIDMKQNPLIVMARQCLQMIRAFCVEFGMTPSSRGRIQVGTGKEKDPMDKFLEGRNKNGKK